MFISKSDASLVCILISEVSLRIFSKFFFEIKMRKEKRKRNAYFEVE